MIKKIFPTFAVCVLAVIVFLFAFNLEKFPSVTSFLKEWREARHPYVIPSNVDRHSFIDTLIQKNEAVSVCDHIKMSNNIEESISLGEEGLRNICIQRFAEARNDYSMCHLMRYSGTVGNTGDCLIWFAEKNADRNLCKDLPSDNMRVDCLIKVGSKLNDASICEEMSDQKYRDYCQRKVNEPE